MASDPIIWLEAFLTLALLSMVFLKKNPVFEYVVSAYLGIGVGHALIMGINVIQASGWRPITQESQYALVVPCIIGVLLFARHSKNIAHWSRIPTALIVGVAAGLGLRGAIVAQFLDQIRGTFVSLDSFGNIVMLVSVVCTVLYFLFSSYYTDRLKGPLGYIPRIGRWAMMVSFGASFASASAGFLSKLIMRVTFLVRDWLGLVS